MKFHSQEQLEQFLLKKCEKAVKEAQEKIYKILDDAVKEFYNEYDPVAYIRTDQLLRSLVKTEIKRVGKGIRAEVYFDASSMNYTSGSRPSGGQVLDAAAQGWHGAVGEHLYYVPVGGGIWDAPMNVLDSQIVDMIINKLKASGVPIK